MGLWISKNDPEILYLVNPTANSAGTTAFSRTCLCRCFFRQAIPCFFRQAIPLLLLLGAKEQVKAAKAEVSRRFPRIIAFEIAPRSSCKCEGTLVASLCILATITGPVGQGISLPPTPVKAAMAHLLLQLMALAAAIAASLTFLSLSPVASHTSKLQAIRAHLQRPGSCSHGQQDLSKSRSGY